MVKEPNGLSGDPELEALQGIDQDRAEQMLAERHAPIICFDDNEPFFPLVAGYTVFRSDAPSPSYPRQVVLAEEGQPEAVFAIEYAIWWDWDIGHLYELEHVWVFVDETGEVVRCDASWHGDHNSMAAEGSPRLEGAHPVVFSEPGKHAFAPDPSWFVDQRGVHRMLEQCTRQAGAGGVWVTALFREDLRRLRTPLANTLVRTYLQRQAFEPELTFNTRVVLTAGELVPWPALADWIPVRVASVLERLAGELSGEELHFLRIGHRGASAHAPENTLAAFRKAAELGANGVELDVQLCADGVPVVIHDLTASRLGEPRAVAELTFDELRALDAGNGERIPTLDEALACCAEVRLIPYIEVKAGGAVPAAVRGIREHGWYLSAVIGSFRPDWVAAVKMLDPNVATSILFGAPNIDAVAMARAVGADYVHPCWENAAPEPYRLLTPEWMARVREAGLGIVLWHEERPSEIVELRRKGVDMICSDAPELLG